MKLVRRRRLAIVLLGVSLLAGSSVSSSLAMFTDASAPGGTFGAGSVAPPAGLAATGGLTVGLTWTATSTTTAAGYDLYRATAAGGPYGLIATITPRTTVSATDSPAPGTYWYILRAFQASWESIDAGPVSATVGTPVSTAYAACVGASNAADTTNAGDNNGYQTNPTRVCTDDGLAANDGNSGNGGTDSCGTGAVPSVNKDRHRFWGYASGVPATATSIAGIRVRADLALNNNGGTTNLCAQLSWDGGTTWTALKSLSLAGTGETTYVFGSATDTWGRAWAVSELGSSNFRVRLVDASTMDNKRFELDYLALSVTYTP